VHHQAATGTHAAGQVVDEGPAHVEHRSVQVVHREPHRPSVELGRVVPIEPLHVVGISIVQLVPFGQAHNGVGAGSGQHALDIGTDDVLAAEPQAPGHAGERNLVQPAVVVPDGRHGS
jgi:hypothetical protein